MIEKLKKFESSLAVTVSIIAGITYLNVWWKDTVVSREVFDAAIEQQTKNATIANTEMTLRFTQGEIRSYQRYGLDKLTDQQRHAYENLLKAEEKLTDTRNCLLGLSDGC